ncbi:MAG: HK97 gp10 family phage protein [Porcipelethomonas sp.]
MVTFTSNSAKAKSAIDNTVSRWLEETASGLERQARENTAVDTGKTRAAWTHVTDSEAGEAVVGNPVKNAVWEEFGTGEYALEGNGRKGGWSYADSDGNWHFTRGKRPKRALQRAFESEKLKAPGRMEAIAKEEFK